MHIVDQADKSLSTHQHIFCVWNFCITGLDKEWYIFDVVAFLPVRGAVVFPCSKALMLQYAFTSQDQLAQDPSAIDMFITGNRMQICIMCVSVPRTRLFELLSLSVCLSGSNFTEWFTSYVDNVVTGEYPIIRDQIFRWSMQHTFLF